MRHPLRAQLLRQQAPIVVAVLGLAHRGYVLESNSSTARASGRTYLGM
ncbi:MAG: hypothetical protein HYV92_10350 [Candidatus Rokubacteria bacterium]|nr:hypothetical protein [Candidatus Rokubacteria bacterium]